MALAQVFGEMPLLFDYKTTEHPPEKENRPPFEEVALQLCAYSRATEAGVLSEQRTTDWGRYYVYDQTVQHEPMPEVRQDVALAIIVSPWDCRAVLTTIDEGVWEAWRHVQELAFWQRHRTADLFRAAYEAKPTPFLELNGSTNPLD